jgi:hypothetical protein
MGERRGCQIYRGEGGKWRVAVGERRTSAFNPIKRINGVSFFSVALMESKWERKKKQSREELLNVMDERMVGQARGRSGSLGRAGVEAWRAGHWASGAVAVLGSAGSAGVGLGRLLARGRGQGTGGRHGQPQAGARGMAGAPRAVLAQLVAWRGRGERAGREEREWGGRERLGERERAVEAAAARHFQQARALHSARVWGNGPLVGRFSVGLVFLVFFSFFNSEMNI